MTKRDNQVANASAAEAQAARVLVTPTSQQGQAGDEEVKQNKADNQEALYYQIKEENLRKEKAMRLAQEYLEHCSVRRFLYIDLRKDVSKRLAAASELNDKRTIVKCFLQLMIALEAHNSAAVSELTWLMGRVDDMQELQLDKISDRFRPHNTVFRPDLPRHNYICRQGSPYLYDNEYPAYLESKGVRKYFLDERCERGDISDEEHTESLKAYYQHHVLPHETDRKIAKLFSKDSLQNFSRCEFLTIIAEVLNHSEKNKKQTCLQYITCNGDEEQKIALLEYLRENGSEENKAILFNLLIQRRTIDVQQLCFDFVTMHGNQNQFNRYCKDIAENGTKAERQALLKYIQGSTFKTDYKTYTKHFFSAKPLQCLVLDQERTAYFDYMLESETKKDYADYILNHIFSKDARQCEKQACFNHYVKVEDKQEWKIYSDIVRCHGTDAEKLAVFAVDLAKSVLYKNNDSDSASLKSDLLIRLAHEAMKPKADLKDILQKIAVVAKHRRGLFEADSWKSFCNKFRDRAHSNLYCFFNSAKYTAKNIATLCFSSGVLGALYMNLREDKIKTIPKYNALVQEYFGEQPLIHKNVQKYRPCNAMMGM